MNKKKLRGRRCFSCGQRVYFPLSRVSCAVRRRSGGMEHVCALCGSLKRGQEEAGRQGTLLFRSPAATDPTQPAAFTSTGLCAAE